MKAPRFTIPAVICYAVGVLVPLIISGFQGMPISAGPLWFVWFLVFWIAAFILFYFSYCEKHKERLTTFRLWRKICVFISDYTSMILLSSFLTAACFYPSGIAAGLPKQQMTFVAISLFIMGIGIPLSEWKRIFKKPLPIFETWLIRWVCMPLLALGIGLLIFGTLVKDPEMSQQLIAAQTLIGTTATGGASNVYTFLVGGDAPLSILTTALSTLTDPLIQPPIAKLLIGTIIDVPVGSMMLDLVKNVIAPLVIGVLISTFILKDRVKKVQPLFSAATVVFMFPMFLGAFCGGWGTLLQNLYIIPILLLADVIHAGLGCCIGYFLPGKIFKFKEPQKRAALFEIGVENVSITSALAFNYFGPLASTAAMIYGLTQTVIVMIVIRLFKSKDVKAEKKKEELALAAGDAGEVKVEATDIGEDADTKDPS